MSGLNVKLRTVLESYGCHKEPYTANGAELWRDSLGGLFVVPSQVRSRLTAERILRAAGIPEDALDGRY